MLFKLAQDFVYGFGIIVAVSVAVLSPFWIGYLLVQGSALIFGGHPTAWFFVYFFSFTLIPAAVHFGREYHKHLEVVAAAKLPGKIFESTYVFEPAEEDPRDEYERWFAAEAAGRRKAPDPPRAGG